MFVYTVFDNCSISIHDYIEKIFLLNYILKRKDQKDHSLVHIHKKKEQPFLNLK